MSLERDVASSAELAQRLAYEMEIPAVALLQPALDRLDAKAWDIRRTAIAVMTRMMVLAPTQFDPARAREVSKDIEERFQAELTRDLTLFARGMDPEARGVATRIGGLELSLYNFLVRAPHRTWRLQFARTAPLLLYAAATGTRGSTGAQIRAVVDAGLPLVKNLAQLWEVTPGALRCLLERPGVHVGARWEAEPRTLVRVLDAIRPEDRPGDDPREWERLTKAVETAEEIFRRPVASSPLTLGWLRQAARRRFASLNSRRGGQPLLPEAVSMIDELRVATIRHFTRRLESDAREEGDLRAAVATVVDRQLAMLAVTRLSAIARKFALEYASRRASLEEAMRFADGTLFWPLFPSEFLTADGLRKVTPLATRDELRAEGTLQDLCIKGGSELTRMIAACASGRTFLVSVRDAITETRLSTAEIHLSRAVRGGMLEVGIRQHRAAGNAQPSLGCASALREALVAVGSREVQDHLAEGQRMAWKRRMLTESTEADADEAVLRETLRIALGERVYEALSIVALQRESRSIGSGR